MNFKHKYGDWITFKYNKRCIATIEKCPIDCEDIDDDKKIWIKTTFDVNPKWTYIKDVIYLGSNKEVIELLFK